MKLASTEALEALAGHKLVFAAAIKIVLPDETFRLWTGHGNLAIDGEDEPFKGVAAPAIFCPIGGELGGGSSGIEITLSKLDPDIAATIEDSDYHQKPVTIWRLIFDPKGATLLGAPVFMRGRLDTAPIVETIGGQSAIMFKIEGPRRDMSRSNARIRSDTDQRLIDPDDGCLKHISVAGRKTLSWGGVPTPGVSSVGGGNGGPLNISGGAATATIFGRSAQIRLPWFFR